VPCRVLLSLEWYTVYWSHRRTWAYHCGFV